MNTSKFLSVPENSAATRIISELVLTKVASSEVATTASFIEPVLDMMANDQEIHIDTSDEAGGFGGADLAVLVVVPVITTILSNFLLNQGLEKITAYRKSLDQSNAQVLFQVDTADLQVMIKGLGADWNRRKVRKLTKAINTILLEYLADEENKYSLLESAGISPDLYVRLQATLLNCGLFTNDSELKAIFVDQRINPWRNNLPRADTPIGRVRAVIDLLHNQYTAAQENALALFLYVLRDQIDTGNACHHTLTVLANELERTTSI